MCTCVMYCMCDIRVYYTIKYCTVSQTMPKTNMDSNVGDQHKICENSSYMKTMKSVDCEDNKMC